MRVVAPFGHSVRCPSRSNSTVYRESASPCDNAWNRYSIGGASTTVYKQAAKGKTGRGNHAAIATAETSSLPIPRHAAPWHLQTGKRYTGALVRRPVSTLALSAGNNGRTLMPWSLRTFPGDLESNSTSSQSRLPNGLLHPVLNHLLQQVSMAMRVSFGFVTEQRDYRFCRHGSQGLNGSGLAGRLLLVPGNVLRPRNASCSPVREKFTAWRNVRHPLIDLNRIF